MPENDNDAVNLLFKFVSGWCARESADKARLMDRTKRHQRNYLIVVVSRIASRGRGRCGGSKCIAGLHVSVTYVALAALLTLHRTRPEADIGHVTPAYTSRHQRLCCAGRDARVYWFVCLFETCRHYRFENERTNL